MLLISGKYGDQSEKYIVRLPFIIQICFSMTALCLTSFEKQTKFGVTFRHLHLKMQCFAINIIRSSTLSINTLSSSPKITSCSVILKACKGDLLFVIQSNIRVQNVQACKVHCLDAITREGLDLGSLKLVKSTLFAMSPRSVGLCLCVQKFRQVVTRNWS